jgi:hypothetical protein
MVHKHNQFYAMMTSEAMTTIEIVIEKTLIRLADKS